MAGQKRRLVSGLMVLAVIVSLLGFVVWSEFQEVEPVADTPEPDEHAVLTPRLLNPRMQVDTSGFSAVLSVLPVWSENASLEEVRELWANVGDQECARIDQRLENPELPLPERVNLLVTKAMLLNYEGDPHAAYEVLKLTRTIVEGHPQFAAQFLGTLIYMQGVTALRCGETDNCVKCRGESSCILPISSAAVHVNQEGSRRAIQHFREYMMSFPEDLEVRWLLNVAYMTLGEHPHGVEREYLVSLEVSRKPELEIGQFREIGAAVGLNRFNTAGGGIMDDFDLDGLLDVVVTASGATERMGIYRNKSDGTFQDCTERSGAESQFGGLYCIQSDYDNDGYPDIFIPRGAWLNHPIRPTLLHNEGGMQFADVTDAAGLDHSANSICAAWADYNNDGNLDLFVGCERQPNRLYLNSGNGTFQEVGKAAGITGSHEPMTKGCAWIDIDNDDDPDLFLTSLTGNARLFLNEGGIFRDVSLERGIDGPNRGFACWSWDYDNDGWLDLFATSYDYTLADIVKGLLGEPHARHSNRLFHNEAGRSFRDVTAEAGLDLVFATMGCNYGDLDNDGFLEMYLGTGDPQLGMLVPNRMFKNVDGARFYELTTSTRTGHLQKGHSAAFGDWDRDGNVDIFMQMGGATPGDRYHNILFQNPGHKNHWLTVRLMGRQTNRSAIGARISISTAEPNPVMIHRHISSGSSFGANPLEQTIGLGQSPLVARLEIHWPTSRLTQVFHDIAADRIIVIREGDDQVRTIDSSTVTHNEIFAP